MAGGREETLSIRGKVGNVGGRGAEECIQPPAEEFIGPCFREDCLGSVDHPIGCGNKQAIGGVDFDRPGDLSTPPDRKCPAEARQRLLNRGVRVDHLGDTGEDRLAVIGREPR